MKRSIALSVILIALLIAIPMPVRAGKGFISGNDLVNDMKESENCEEQTDIHSCSRTFHYMGYVTAAADIYSGLDVICLNDGVTRGQLVAVVTSYLKANPDKWDRPAIELVTTALKKAFPCK